MVPLLTAATLPRSSQKHQAAASHLPRMIWVRKGTSLVVLKEFKSGPEGTGGDLGALGNGVQEVTGDGPFPVLWYLAHLQPSLKWRRSWGPIGQLASPHLSTWGLLEKILRKAIHKNLEDKGLITSPQQEFMKNEPDLPL